MLAHAGQRHSQRFGQLVIVDAVPITVQWPALRASPALDLAPFLLAEFACAKQVEEFAAIGAGAQSLVFATALPASDRPAP